MSKALVDGSGNGLAPLSKSLLTKFREISSPGQKVIISQPVYKLYKSSYEETNIQTIGYHNVEF